MKVHLFLFQIADDKEGNLMLALYLPNRLDIVSCNQLK